MRSLFSLCNISTFACINFIGFECNSTSSKTHNLHAHLSVNKKKTLIVAIATSVNSMFYLINYTPEEKPHGKSYITSGSNFAISNRTTVIEIEIK